jgi:hypothetical protein
LTQRVYKVNITRRQADVFNELGTPQVAWLHRHIGNWDVRYQPGGKLGSWSYNATAQGWVYTFNNREIAILFALTWL